MPLTGKAKADYQRELMKKRRVKPTNESSESASGAGTRSAVRARDRANGASFDVVAASEGRPAWSTPPGHEHYWMRGAGDTHAVCTEFEYQGRKIGGCGQRRKYEGKLLPTFDDHPDLSAAIVDSPMAHEIQQKMPVTKGRDPR